MDNFAGRFTSVEDCLNEMLMSVRALYPKEAEGTVILSLKLLPWSHSETLMPKKFMRWLQVGTSGSEEMKQFYFPLRPSDGHQMMRINHAALVEYKGAENRALVTNGITFGALCLTILSCDASVETNKAAARAGIAALCMMNADADTEISIEAT